MMSPIVMAHEMAERMRASYGFMLRLLQITSSGATPTPAAWMRYGMWCVRTCAAMCAAICWLKSTNAEFKGWYVCADAGSALSASGSSSVMGGCGGRVDVERAAGV